VILALAICGAKAETAGTWRLHGTLEGDATPKLLSPRLQRRMTMSSGAVRAAGAAARFYDFGFGIKQIDGRLSNETVQGLIAFQKWAGLPETGQLTKLTLQKIDATEAPSAWAALVFDGLGIHSMVTGDTRRAAEADAVIVFRKKWRSDFNVASVPAPHCVAISTTRYKTRRRTFTQAFTSMGESAGEAGQNSLDYCNREKGGGTCQTRDAICAAGGAASAL
jgi:Putative peptidoglycan binding domain